MLFRSEYKQKIADEILKFIYDSVPVFDDGLFFAPDKNISEYKAVFKDIFTAIGQRQHYVKMSGEYEATQ